jgi:H/ACA ribonucleoprotein complex non-core subunit NAF1
MAEERGSDDEDGESSKPRDPALGSSRVRTANEQSETLIPVPDITLTSESRITPLGVVEGTVEDTVLVKANVAGDYQVLETGSVL